MQFVSNREVVVRSLSGHSIKFLKGVPTDVPRAMISEVMEKGILPVDEKGKTLDPEEVPVSEAPKVVLAPEDGYERHDKIYAVIKAIIERNSPKDFTGGGRPHAGSVTSALGWRVDQKEVNGVWEKHRAELIGKKE